MLPPERDALIQAFETPPRPKTRSSSGAVALCKHFERGGASSEHGKAHPFWPLPTGSNDNKTKLAAATMDKMLNDIAWKNVMLLHPGVAVYEIRNSLGYGMRWTLDVEDDTSKPKDLSPSNLAPITGESNIAGENAEKKRTIKTVSFRGFLEPIIGMDDELPRHAGNG